MGILDSIAGQVLGNQPGQNNLLNAVMGMLASPQAGGIQGLVQQFAGKGLGNVVNSWVGTGANLPVTADQIQSVLGTGTLAKLASQAGIAPEQVSQQLSQLLPHVVDKLTPDGKIPQGDILSKGAELLKGLMK